MVRALPRKIAAGFHWNGTAGFHWNGKIKSEGTTLPNSTQGHVAIPLDRSVAKIGTPDNAT